MLAVVLKPSIYIAAMWTLDYPAAMVGNEPKLTATEPITFWH